MSLLAAAGILGTAALADAGPFGGFSKDGKSYLAGRDRICEPVRDPMAAPRCAVAKPDEIARRHFVRGPLEGGAGAAITARASGTVIEIFRGESAEPVARWDAGVLVTGIEAVDLDPGGNMAGVEYRARSGGRQVEEAIALTLPPVGGAAASAGAGQAGGGTVAVPFDGARRAAPPVDDKALRAAMAKGNRLARRRRHKRALAAYQEALRIAPDEPEARFRVAASLAALGKRAQAIAALSELAASRHPDAPVWLVEARTHSAFAALRRDKAFRRAVGIDGGREQTAYERLVGKGGHWEQAAVPCEKPRVNLKLERDRRRNFSLIIRSRCGGQTDTTTLKGTWKTRGALGLLLEFPNPGQDAENLTCEITSCNDGSREDCVVCQVDRDLQFTLQVVRR